MFAVLALALALASTACQPPVQGARGLSEEDVAAIRRITDSYTQAALAGDWAAVAGFYAGDALFMPANESAVEGRAAIQAWYEALPTMTEFAVRPVEIDGRGDLAYVRGAHSITLTPEGVPESIQDTGKYISNLRKQPDGSWLAVVGITNSDLPLPGEGAESET